MTNPQLSQYDGKELVSFTLKDGLVGNDVQCIHQDRQGNIWFGTRSGLSRYDGVEFVNFTDKDGLVGNDLRCVHQGKVGNIWIGTTMGLSRYDGVEFVNFTLKDGLVGNDVQCIHQDREGGNIWIGTTKGLSRYDGERFVSFTDKDGLVGNHIRCLHQDKEGNIWIGTWDDGVSCYDGNEFVDFTTEHGLAHNNISDIAQDREGSIWFACHHGGVSRYNPYGISSISDESVKEVIMQGRDGSLWWGFGNILSRFDGNNASHYPFEYTIYELLEDSKGQLWVGTDGGGVFKYSNIEEVGREKPQNLTTDNELAHNLVIRIYEDMQGNIWIGTHDGLVRCDGVEFVNFTTDDGLGNNVVSAICQDRSGVLWSAGWAGGGITGYDGKGFHTYTKEDGLVGGEVICMIEDDKSILWVGTPVGISCYDGRAFKNYTVEDGLLSGFAQRMLQDSRKQIWIATLGGGISRFDGRNFQALTTEDGLPSNCVTGIIEDTDGSMIISTYKGICRYALDHETAPLICIDEVDADRIYKEPEWIQISESISLIGIKYHGVSFKTKRMRYNYILEGYDKDWKATWDEKVRYENLPIGEYTFKVVAVNRDLVYSERPAELRLKVIADTRDVVIGELEERVRERTKELEEKTEELSKSNEELNAFVYTVSHDLKAPIVSLQGFASLLMKDYEDSLDEMGRMYIDRILKNSERMGILTENLLELSRISRIKGQEEPVKVSDIVSDVVEELAPQLKARGIRLKVKDDMPTLLCDRTRISQIFANLIDNASKFMGDDNNDPTIEVGYNDQDGYHKFYVRDNGIGIDEEYHEKVFQVFQRLDDIDTEGTGVGLAIVKKIVENFGGRIWVDSAKGKGATIRFTVPKTEIEGNL